MPDASIFRSYLDSVALSNMDVIEETLLDRFPRTEPETDMDHLCFRLMKSLETQRADETSKRWKMTKFTETPKMSTYLLTFAVSSRKVKSSPSSSLTILPWMRCRTDTSTTARIHASALSPAAKSLSAYML